MSVPRGRPEVALFDHIDRRPVECIEIGRDRYKRTVSVCTVAGTDIADWLVRNGLALDSPQYSKDGYTDAKREQRGMWDGSFREPWVYRAKRFTIPRTPFDPHQCAWQLR
jgi:endonuclease YncB( thermonuclease family)